MPATTDKIFYKIGDACKELDIQPYVLRYWETEFPFLKPDKSRSGQRVYSAEDLAVIRRIKELLYEEGYTIAGAKKKLESELDGQADENAEANDQSEDADPTANQSETTEEPEGAADSMAALQQSLVESLDTSSDERLETIAHKVRALRDQAQTVLTRLKRAQS